jgi:hypothetical protein
MASTPHIEKGNSNRSKGILARPRKPKNLLIMKRKTEMAVYEGLHTGFMF